MKTLSKFNFGVVNAGQRNVVVSPQLVATSTNGGFRVTAPVSKALGLHHGDYVAFINNLASVDELIASKDADFVAFCEERGLEFGTPEAAAAIHAEFDVWGIAKGWVKKDKTGTPLKIKERLTINDKKNIVNANFDELYQKAQESDDQEFLAALNREGITKDEVVDLLAEYVEGNEVDKYEGSKAASTSMLSGTEVNLNFTDSNVWNKFKADLGEAAKNINRVYNIDIDNASVIQQFNGYETVDVKVLWIDGYEDTTVTPRTSK